MKIVTNFLKVLKLYLSGASFRNSRLRFSTDLTASCEHRGQETWPSVTICIPTRDKIQVVSTLIDGLIRETNYEGRIEILVVDNRSKKSNQIKLRQLSKSLGFRVLSYEKRFNFSKIANFAVENASHDYICLLNNDLVIRDPDWLRRLVEHVVLRPKTIVGTVLTYPDKTIQHAGIVLGKDALAANYLRGCLEDDLSASLGSSTCPEVSAVTFAAVVMMKQGFWNIGGLDERFAVGLNDVDFCTRARQEGYRVVLCTTTRVTHLEGISRKPMTHPFGAARALLEVFMFTLFHGILEEDQFILASKEEEVE